MNNLKRCRDRLSLKEKLSKLICGSMLIIFTIFSTMIFVACGDKYEKLGFEFYSSAGEVIEEIDFTIDTALNKDTQRVGVEITGVDKEDVGQLVIYSEPRELVDVTGYQYIDNFCYVNLKAKMPTSNTANAKLVVSHLGSGKKGEIPLNIEQKSLDVQIVNSKYLISIPKEGEVNHTINVNDVMSLLPIGSTDDVYFRIAPGSALPAGVVANLAEDAGVENVYSGFTVNSTVQDSTSATCVKIYFVTHLEGYFPEPTKEYLESSKQISVYFRHTASLDSVEIKPKDEALATVNLNELHLLANDQSLNTISLDLWHEEEEIFKNGRTDGINFFDLYELQVESNEPHKISAFADSNNGVIVMANTYTDDFVKVDISLRPINYAGDLVRIEKSIYVKGEMKADKIQVFKNGLDISDSANTNIFDYYDEGNALGALFRFVPLTSGGQDVNNSLRKMRIVVDPQILCEENYFGVDPAPANLNSKLYSLMIHKFSDYLRFHEEGGMMISEEFIETDHIYIKYIKGKGTVESADFGLTVETLNNSEFVNWENLHPTQKALSFNRVEGVKSMVVEAGEIAGGAYTQMAQGNPEYVYLNRRVEEPYYYVSATNNEVLSVDGMPILTVDFMVEVVPMENQENTLKISPWSEAVGYNPREYAVSEMKYVHNNAVNEDAIILVFDKTTGIGDYNIIFYQEGVVKNSVICRVYETLDNSSDVTINVETNSLAFENTEYRDAYTDADYIVASGQELLASIELPQAIIDSEIVNGYDFAFEIGYLDASNNVVSDIVLDKTEYFGKAHDDDSFNYAWLNFKKGTYIAEEDRPYYIFVAIYVETVVYNDIVGSTTSLAINSYKTSFYIYEEITNEDISINHTSMVRYVEEYLGVYYKDKSTALLTIEMESSLWNYANKLSADNYVQWHINDLNGVRATANNTNYSISFRTITGITSYVRVVKAFVYQFDKMFELQCVFNVEKPVISQKLSIQSEMKVKQVGQDLEYYINLKNGQSYQFVATNNSSFGQATHPETIIQVFDENGSAFSSATYFDINQTTNTITAKKVDSMHQFKVVIFAKDALLYIPSQDKSGYKNPSSFLMDFAGAEEGLYNQAFFVVDVVLSDGTEENPYLITDANEFWQIDDTDLFKAAYYKLMTSLNLKSTTDTNSRTISGFVGTIKTDADNMFTIDGISLNNDVLYLFDGFAGHIENIRFDVQFSYNFGNSLEVEKYLGLFKENNGTLKDVAVISSGLAKFESRSTTYYFGSLVGQNYGLIEYAKASGVTGDIELEGSSTVYFGGLVGKNVGSIIGCETVDTASGNKIVLNTLAGRDKTLSQISITSRLASTAAIGGVVGLNTYTGDPAVDGQIGVVRNGFVQVVIDAPNTSNVGGVIGENRQKQNSLKVYGNGNVESVEDVLQQTFTDLAIYNMKSASKIVAKNNVGGIVGTDENGLYINCDFQVLSSNRKEIVLLADKNVGGIAGHSKYGKFAYCSVMSYWWNYAGLKTAVETVIVDVADIQGNENVGGIVGLAESDTRTISILAAGTSIDNRTLVVYSSVNAYLKAVKLYSNAIGGILTIANGQRSIIANAYFIGKLECHGELNYSSPSGVCVDNNDSSFFNYVYTLNLEGEGDSTSLVPGNWGIGNSFTINGNPDLDYWWQNVDINGGYAFITLDKDAATGSTPIFDLAPDHIITTVNGETIGDLKQVLRLEYYDFSTNTKLLDEQLKVLDQIYNKSEYVYKTNAAGVNVGKIDIKTKPDNIGTVVINIKSTNSNVLDVAVDGRLLINGVGECELIFSSVLNPNAGDLKDRTIRVIVDYPIGDEFNISTSRSDISKIVDLASTQNIAKGASKLYYPITQGKVEYDFDVDGDEEEYLYLTKTNVNLEIEVKYLTNDNEFKLDEIVSVTGQNGQLSYETGNRVLRIKLDNGTPFSISVLKKLENLSGQNYSLVINVKPYRVINNGTKEIEEYYYTSSNPPVVRKTMFYLSTMEGATAATFSYDEAIVYPNDTVYLTSYLTTDSPVCMLDDGTIDVSAIQALLNKNPIDFGNVRFNVPGKTFVLEQGGFNSDDGGFRNEGDALYNQRVRTKEYVWLTAGEYIISNSSNHQTVVYAYDKDYNFDVENSQTSWENSTYTFVLTEDRFVRFGFRDSRNINISHNIVKDVILRQFSVYVDRSNYDATTQVQTIVFRIEFYDMELTTETQLNLSFQSKIDGEILDGVDYTIIPQRINKIEIKNYYYKNVGDIDNPEYQLVLDDILKPNFAGKMQIDMVPFNGYYDYLEISDITGREEILFIQVDKNGNALTVSDDPSSDKKGIKLYGEVEDIIYVRTQIDERYSSRIHTIEVRAYSAHGKLLARQTKEIDVKMLPEINMDYVLPDGTSGATINSTVGTEPTKLLLANGVDANFKIETFNSNSELEISLSGDLASKYEFKQDNGMHYILERKDGLKVENKDIGKTVKIQIRIYAYLDNGDFEVATCSVEFKIVEFVIHSVSVNNSIETSEKKEIYGFFDKPVELKFYFDKDDISFYDETTINEPYWDTEYHYVAGMENSYEENSSLDQIYTILAALNKDTSNTYLILNDNIKNISGAYEAPATTQFVELEDNVLSIEDPRDEDYLPKYLAAAFMLKYNKAEPYVWDINSYTTEVNPAEDSYYVVNKNYNLNFRYATKWYEPEVVATAEDFLKMETGGRYILKNDIVLEEYVPIDVNLIEFDGNGYKITINSFGLLNDEEIKVGLFKQVYETMIVKNVTVKYYSELVNGEYTFGNIDSSFGTTKVTSYADLCNNPQVNYTSLDFGGIAAENNGIITNCVVEGCMAVRASTIEDKKFIVGEDYAIKLYFGGLVSRNSATGYITNSTSRLSIYSQANIGGFVYSNEGKIASSSVEDGDGAKPEIIYGYNNSLEKTIVVQIAGFAIENSGSISLCGVDLTKSVISAKDISAGFVYSNSGKVEDSYVFMKKVGINNNTFNGFVASTSGTITRAYTYINDGNKADSSDTMFAPAGSKGLTNCIELVNKKAGYTSGIESGLNTADFTLRYYKPLYESERFAFGDNESAVWKLVAEKTPVLVTVKENELRSSESISNGLVQITQNKEIVDGVERTTYNFNFASYGTKENPYIIHDVKDERIDMPSSWTDFFVNDHNKTRSYYRIVKDLDFGTIGDNPNTSELTFMGNIQGNNMTLSNILLYSSTNLDSLGLFKDMKNANDSSITNAVRNLKLTTTSVWAAQTSSVGLLAGVIEDFNVYNTVVDSEGVIMVGGNAVGGVAGVVRGEFDIDQVYSNIGANSTRASSQYNYAIYNAKNNKKQVSDNIRSVYYAGSIFGILDGYSRTMYDINQHETRTLTEKYYHVRNGYVSGNVTLIGDSVGGAFGFVGERVFVERVSVNIDGLFSGVQYSAGIAGENRGIIDNNNLLVTVSEKTYSEFVTVGSGAVGLNLGGLVRNIDISTSIKLTGFGKMAGGVVGRNVYGTINFAHFDGELDAYYTGGIVGANYSGEMLANASYGNGTLTPECKSNIKYLIPKTMVEYKDENLLTIANFENVSVSKGSFDKMIENSKAFYSYSPKEDEPNPTLNMVTVKHKVLGVVAALSYSDEIVQTNSSGSSLNINYIEDNVVFNVKDDAVTEYDATLVDSEQTYTLVKADGSKPAITVKLSNVYTVGTGTTLHQVMYLVGCQTTAFDSMPASYSDLFVIICK